MFTFVTAAFWRARRFPRPGLLGLFSAIPQRLVQAGR
jgi:hypothetical protein